MKRIVTILIILIVLSAIGFGVYRWQTKLADAQASSLQTATIERGKLTVTIGATGIVRSLQSTTLLWKTTGTVEKVNVTVGDQVKAGEVLATLQQTSLPQNIILAQADLVNAQKAKEELNQSAELAKVEAMKAISLYAQAVKNAQYQLDNFTIPANQSGMSAIEAFDAMTQKLDEARAAFEPYKFYPLNDPIRQELKEKLDQAQSDYNAAVKRLDYEYELEVAKANLEKARQDYEKWKNGPDPADLAAVEARIAAANAALNQAFVEAPFDGTITMVEPKPGDQVSIGLQAFRLDDLSALLVDLQVSEIDINLIQVGQEANLTFDAITGKEYHGVVVEVARVGVLTQGVVDFNVIVKLTSADEDIKPGMTAAVNIVVSQIEEAILIPNRAVRVRDGQRVVYILRDGQPVEVKVLLGASSETMTQLLEGEVKEGDTIVLNPPTVFEQSGPPPFVRR